MLRFVSAAAVLIALALSPARADAKTFVFDHSFDATGYGSSSTSGTPRGLAARHSDLFITDALEDEIYRVDATFPHTELDAYGTDPMSCALSAIPANCTVGNERARIVWDIAWEWFDDSLWLIDKEGSNPTWLIELDSGANMLRRVDISASGASPGGLGFDARGPGGLVSTDVGNDWVSHFDLDGNFIGISSIGAHSTAPTGISHFGGDLFFVSDAGADAILEFLLPQGGGASTFVGETVLQGLGGTTLTSIQSVEYDPVTQALYVLDTPSVNFSSVYVFFLVPEPGTGPLLALGLAALGARRRLVPLRPASPGESLFG